MAKISIKPKEAKGVVTQALVDNKNHVTIAEETKQEMVALPAPAPTPSPSNGSAPAGPDIPFCMIAVDASFTKNLGNYQSAKVGVTLTLPAQFEDIDEAFGFAATWVNGKLEGLIADMETA